MLRTMLGTAIGILIAILGLAIWGFTDGYAVGQSTSQTPPGTEAGVKSAFVFVMYLWPIAATLGGGIGGLAALGSWLVRPRTTSHIISS